MVFHLYLSSFLYISQYCFSILTAFLPSYKCYLKKQYSLIKRISCIFIKFRIQIIFARWFSIFIASFNSSIFIILSSTFFYSNNFYRIEIRMNQKKHSTPPHCLLSIEVTDIRVQGHLHKE